MGVAFHACQPSSQEAEARGVSARLGSKAVWLGPEDNNLVLHHVSANSMA